MTVQAPSPATAMAIAAQFIEALCGSPHATVTFQTFDDSPSKDAALARIFHGTLIGCWDALTDLNNRGAGIFYCVNKTDERGRLAKNIIDLRAVFIDKDNGFIDPSKIRLAPNIRIMSSPGKEHALWLLHPGEERSRFQSVQKSLIAHFDSDISIHDLPRVLRLPGTVHRKAEPYLLDKVWYGSSQKHTLDQILEAYPPFKSVPKPPSSEGRPSGENSGRNSYLTSFAGKLRAQGASVDELLTKLLAENEALSHPLDDAEVQRIANSISRYEPKVDPQFLKEISIQVAKSEPWTSSILRDSKGEPKTCLANAVTILDNHPDWKDTISLNERTAEIVLSKAPPCDRTSVFGPYPRPVTDGDLSRIAQWFGQVMHIGDVPVMRAMLPPAERRKFDPVCDELSAVAWDQVQRISTLFTRYCDARDAPPEYLSAVARKWLVQCVARAFAPGCQGDLTLILQGHQGAAKTSFFRVLAGKYFGENPPRDMGQKMQEFIRGPWIVEFGELSSFARSELEDVKAFLTNLIDRYRPAYGQTTGNFPRRCAFGGSTNKSIYLHDITGNRRFAPVSVGEINIAELKRDRDQIWAEALHLYRSGATWHVSREEISMFSVQQNARTSVDSIIPAISEALEKGIKRSIFGLSLTPMLPWEKPSEWSIEPNAQKVTTSDIAKYVLGARDHDTRMQSRIHSAMQSLGWRHDFRRMVWVR